MAVWAMLLGLVTLVNITMAAALISLMGNVPDGPFLVIASRYLRRKSDPPEAVLHPLEAAARLERLRRRALAAAGAAALVAAGMSIWALAVGWGTVAMLSVTAWFVAGNLAFLELPLGAWRRRAGKMREEVVEEALRLRHDRAGEGRSAAGEASRGDAGEGDGRGEGGAEQG